MRKVLQPLVARFISSSILLGTKRWLLELRRWVLRQPHVISVFIRVDDPYSYLLLQVMPELEGRYRVEFRYHVVSGLQENMFPEPELWHENALKDSRHIAKLYQLDLPVIEELPPPELTESVTNQLLILEQGSNFVESACTALKAYWSTESIEIVVDQDLSSRLAENDALLDSLGHYLSATLYYGGEWYWGIDRLSHLERRLNALNLSRSEDQIRYHGNTEHFCRRLTNLDDLPKRADEPLTIYFSARSPYSYLGLERGVTLARHYGVPILIKPVLPMLMRGMSVPDRKKWYIFSDTKREALNLGLEYGNVADPLGAGVERCYALFDYARSQGKEVAYLLAFARAVNTRGIHSDTDSGMKAIVEEAGLDWSQAEPLLTRDDWRVWADANYQEMHEKGLWGVPCFEYSDVAVWGQDRIDVIEQAICQSIELSNQ